MAALDRQDSQYEADRERSFITHEDGSRRKVEYHESRQRSGQRERRDHCAGVLMQSSDRRDTQGGDNSHACSQSVDSIDQIERVGRGDQPENRQRDIQGIVGEKIEMRSPPHEDADRGKFEEQFVARPEIDDVVEQADQAHRDCESREPGNSVIGQAGNYSDEADCRDEGDHHREAAQQRSRLLMRTVARRMGNYPEVERCGLGHRHHRHDDQKRNRWRECYYKSTGQACSLRPMPRLVFEARILLRLSQTNIRRHCRLPPILG